MTLTLMKRVVIERCGTRQERMPYFCLCHEAWPWNWADGKQWNSARVFISVNHGIEAQNVVSLSIYTTCLSESSGHTVGFWTQVHCRVSFVLVFRSSWIKFWSTVYLFGRQIRCAKLFRKTAGKEKRLVQKEAQYLPTFVTPKPWNHYARCTFFL